jgi:hypothetical protein
MRLGGDVGRAPCGIAIMGLQCAIEVRIGHGAPGHGAAEQPLHLQQSRQRHPGAMQAHRPAFLANHQHALRAREAVRQARATLLRDRFVRLRGHHRTSPISTGKRNDGFTVLLRTQEPRAPNATPEALDSCFRRSTDRVKNRCSPITRPPSRSAPSPDPARYCSARSAPPPRAARWSAPDRPRNAAPHRTARRPAPPSAARLRAPRAGH